MPDNLLTQDILDRLEAIQMEQSKHGESIAKLLERTKDLHTPLNCPLATEVREMRRKIDKWGGFVLAGWFILTIAISFLSRWIPNPWR